MRRWTVLLGNDSVAIRDMAEPVVGIIEWAQDYVSNALSSSPYGSIAWAGVCLLLPVSSVLAVNPGWIIFKPVLVKNARGARQLIALAAAQSIQATKVASHSS